MIQVEVVREDPDKLGRVRWVFRYFEGHQLKLVVWAREHRASRRHKYKATAYYSHLHFNRAWTNADMECVKVAPKIPLDIANDAVAQFTSALKVTRNEPAGNLI